MQLSVFKNIIRTITSDVKKMFVFKSSIRLTSFALKRTFIILSVLQSSTMLFIPACLISFNIGLCKTSLINYCRKMAYYTFANLMSPFSGRCFKVIEFLELSVLYFSSFITSCNLIRLCSFSYKITKQAQFKLFTKAA